MLAKVNSAALYGIDALRVEVEIDLASRLPLLATVHRPILRGRMETLTIFQTTRRLRETGRASRSGELVKSSPGGTEYLLGFLNAATLKETYSRYKDVSNGLLLAQGRLCEY